MLPVLAAAAIALFFLTGGRRSGGRDRAIDRLEKMRGSREDTGHAGNGAPARSVTLSMAERLARLLPARLRGLLAAGLEKHADGAGFNIGQLVGMRAAGTLAFPAITLLSSRFSDAGLVAAPAVAALGFMLPAVLAARRRGRHLDSVRCALPGAADILYASVLGGRNLDQAFRSASAAAAEPLRSLLSTALAEMELGASRAEAFERLLERCPLPELAALLRSLMESERRGYPLSQTLEVFSRDIRLKRRDELRAAAASAPVKLLAPLVFLILPASVILTVGPTFLVALKRGF